jgi:Zn-dependent protease/predicted transcriptional regulator
MFPTNKGLKIFTVSDIPVRVDWSWIIIFILVTWSLAGVYFPLEFPGRSVALYWGLGAISALLLFVSILLHEISHSVVAKKTGLPVSDITLFIFGGVSQMTEEPEDPVQEFKIAAAGPLVSLILVFVFWGLAVLLQTYTGFQPAVLIFNYLAIVNGVILAFNLFPGLPLDGGRIFRAILWKITGSLKQSTKVASWIGSGFGIFLIAAGFFLVLAGNFGGLWFVIIGFFLYQAARVAYENLYLTRILADVSIKEVMSENPITVPANISIAQLVKEYFMKHPYRGYPVVEFGAGEKIEGAEPGQVRGFITLNDVINIDRDRWESITVQDVINTQHLSCPRIDAESNLKDSLREMLENGHPCLVVTENENLKGVVSRQDIMNMIAVRSQLFKEKGS